MCRELGLEPDVLLGLADHRGVDALSEAEKLALDYAVALSNTPAEVSDELYAALAGCYSERQLVELTAVVAFENFLARFNRGFRIEPAGFSEGTACPMPDHAMRAASHTASGD